MLVHWRRPTFIDLAIGVVHGSRCLIQQIVQMLIVYCMLLLSVFNVTVVVAAELGSFLLASVSVTNCLFMRAVRCHDRSS